MMPRSGTLTEVSAYFCETAAVNLIGFGVTIFADVYTSTTPNNTFSFIPAATVTLAPELTGSVSAGTIRTGSTTGLSIPLSANTLVLVVFTARVTSIGGFFDIAQDFTGFASAGIVIE